jgi:hypothetical protein
MRSRRRSPARGRSDLEVLRERCAVASRCVELRAAARDRADARVLADPDNREAFEDLETAEQLHYLALYELRRARRALRRREAFGAYIARWLPTPPVRPRRR